MPIPGGSRATRKSSFVGRISIDKRACVQRTITVYPVGQKRRMGRNALKRALPPQSNSLGTSQSALVSRPMLEDSRAPKRGAGGSRCNTEVWQWSVAKKDPQFGSSEWSEKDLHGARVQRKRVIGSVERYPNEAAARYGVTVLLAEINSEKSRIRIPSITVAQLCDHFAQRELAKDNTWRSHATKKTYQAYLNRWVRPHWRQYELAEVRTIQVECWLRRLPFGEEQLRQDSKFDVRPIQPRLPIRVV